MTSARENILARLRASQEKRGEIEVQSPDFTSPVYHPLSGSLINDFKINLESIGGEVLVCAENSDIATHIQRICQEKKQESVFCTDPEISKLLGNNLSIVSDEASFEQLNIGITGCEFLVAHLGSVLVSSAHVSGRRLNVYPETHIVIAGINQITGYLEDAMKKLEEKYKKKLPSLISNITGPSRTADIEKTLVMGMHGPKSLIVIIAEETF